MGVMGIPGLVPTAAMSWASYKAMPVDDLLREREAARETLLSALDKLLFFSGSAQAAQRATSKAGIQPWLPSCEEDEKDIGSPRPATTSSIAMRGTAKS